MKVNIMKAMQDLLADKAEDLKITEQNDLSFFVGNKIRPQLCEKCSKVAEKGPEEKPLTLKKILIESLFASYKDDVIINKKGKVVYNVKAEDNYNKAIIGKKIAWAAQRKKSEVDLTVEEIQTAKKAVGRKYIQSPMVMSQAWDMLEGKKHDFEKEEKKDK